MSVVILPNCHKKYSGYEVLSCVTQNCSHINIIVFEFEFFHAVELHAIESPLQSNFI